MKSTLSLTFIIAMLFSLQAVGQSFEKGTNVINAGIGFGSALGGRGTQTPAISASYEHGIWEIGDNIGVVSLGGYLGMKRYRYNYNRYTDSWNYTIIGFRSAFHYVGFTDLPKLDVYAGLMASYNHLRYRSDYDDYYWDTGVYGSRVGTTGFIGGRWYFSDNIAGYLELGYGVAHANLGVSFKF